MPKDSRVEDALISAGGLSTSADRTWTVRYLNLAARLSDGQKIYIPKLGEQSEVLTANNSSSYQNVSSSFSNQESGLVNINTASQKELEELPGIGPVYAQSIIEHRPYSSVDELLSKGVLKKSTFEKIKDKVSLW